MNKLNRLVVCVRGNLQQPLKRSASHGHDHHVQKSSGPSNPLTKLLTKVGYWDQQPICGETVTYRNNYGIVGGLNIPKKEILAGDFLMGLFWAWMFWHLYFEFHHITGHYAPPDPSVWTDEELGIPPDDVE